MFGSLVSLPTTTPPFLSIPLLLNVTTFAASGSAICNDRSIRLLINANIILHNSLATLCCCFVAEEGCECCADCCECCADCC